MAFTSKAFLLTTIMFLLLIIIFISLTTGSTDKATSFANISISESSPQEVNFIARLIHRTSPDSPFYDPRESPEDIMADNIRTSFSRTSYFHYRRVNQRSAQAPISNELSMHFQIGSPPFPTYGIPDTGSPLIWLQCDPCDKCYNQRIPYFDPNGSMTYSIVDCPSPECLPVPYFFCHPSRGCVYLVQYGDHSNSSGYVSKEVFTLVDSRDMGPATFEDIIFGCGYNNFDTTGTHIPGMVGLQNHSLSLIGQLGFPSFSYCMGGRNLDGWIRFGSAAVLEGVTTPFLPNPYHNYHLILKGIKVGDSILLNVSDFFETKPILNETGLIIDSGTSITHLYHEAFDELISGIQRSTLVAFDNYQINNWELCLSDIHDYNDLPRITLQFKGMELKLSLRNTWIATSSGFSTFYCLMMRRSDVPLSILGTTQLRNINVGYDLQNNQLWLDNSCPA